MKSVAWTVGFLVGALSVIIISAIIARIAKKKNKNYNKYDERQLALRGIAYKAGFLTFVFAEIFAMIFIANFGQILFEAHLLHFIILMLGCLVVGIVLIWNDAYFTIGQQKIKFIIYLIIFGLINVGIFIYQLLSGYEFIVDGLLTFECVNILCAAFLFIYAINIIIKLIVDKKKENTEEIEEAE